MSRSIRRSCGGVLVILAAAAVLAPPLRAGEGAPRDVRVEGARASAMPPGARTAALYLTIINGGSAADRLVAASSPVAAAVELHSMSMDGGVMRMRAVRDVAIPAHGQVRFAPGELHIMMVDPKPPLAAGQRVPLTLTFARSGKVEVTVPVEPLQPPVPSHAH